MTGAGSTTLSDQNLQSTGRLVVTAGSTVQALAVEPTGQLRIGGNGSNAGTAPRLTITPATTDTTNLWNIDNNAGTLRIFRENWAATGSGAGGAVRLQVTDAGNVTINSGTLTVSGTGTSSFGGNLSIASTSQLSFGSSVSDKINLYSTSYGLGISGSTFQLYSGGSWSFRTGAYNGTEVAQISSAGGISSDGSYTDISTGRTLRDNNGGWVRTYDSTGWYNGTYGSGFYSTSSQLIDTYNSSSLRVNGSLTASNSYTLGGLSGTVGGDYLSIGSASSIQGYVNYNDDIVASSLWVQAGLLGYENTSGTSATGACRTSGAASGFNGVTLYRVGHCTSLGRYKDNQQPLSIGLTELRQLQAVEFDWNINNNGHDLGFIAEQVEAVSPLLAEYTNGQLSGVKYNQMSSLLVKSVQQLDVQVQNVEARLSVLESGQLAGSLAVQGDTSVQKLTVNGKIISSGTAPTLALGQALSGVLGATITGDGTDTAGTVVVSSGSQASLAGEIADVTFTGAYTTAPKIVLSGNNALSAKLGAYIVRTTTGFKIVTDDPLQLGQTYSFDYIIIEARN